MPSWPASLPQKQFIGASSKRQDAVLRTTMDAGPPSRRNRFSGVTKDVDTPIILTGSQLQTFEAFFETTLSNGATTFDWEDPIDDTTVSFAFRSPPQWQLVRGGTSDERVWTATLNLEIQP